MMIKRPSNISSFQNFFFFIITTVLYCTYCSCGTIPDGSDIGVLGAGVIGWPVRGVTGAFEGFDG